MNGRLRGFAITCLILATQAKADGPPYAGATQSRHKEVHVTYGIRGIDYEYGSRYDPGGANNPSQGIIRSSVVASSFSTLFIPGGVGVEQDDILHIPISPPGVSGWYSAYVTLSVQGKAFSVGNSFLLPGNADGSFSLWLVAQILDGGVRRGWGDTNQLCATDLDEAWEIVANGVLNELLSLAGLGAVGDLITLFQTLESAAVPVCEAPPPSQIILHLGGAFLEAGAAYDLEVKTIAYASSLSVATAWGAHVGASDYEIQVTDVTLVLQPTPPGLPVINAIAVSPNPTPQGKFINIQATDVIDPDGAAIVAVEFYRDVDGDGLISPSTDDFLGAGWQSGSDWQANTVASWAVGIHGILARATTDFNQVEWGPVASTQLLVQPPNSPPTLTNPRVTPSSGNESTEFEFAVHYYDPDGQAPHPDYKKVYVKPSGSPEDLGGDMALIGGSFSDGTYAYTTVLPPGSYVHSFFFADTEFASIQTPWRSGPTVYPSSDVPVTVHVNVDGGPLSPCMEFSAWGWGNRIDIPLDRDEFTFTVPAGADVEVWYSATACCPSYECDGSELYVNGSPVASGTCTRWFQLGPTAEYVDLYLDYSYRQDITYVVSGTVLLENGTPVPGGVDVTLNSPVQQDVVHTNDGNFSFAASGGVTVSVALSADGYAFSPGGFTFREHCDHQTGVSVTAFSWDTLVPTTSLLAFPPAVGEDSAVSFTWIGADDVSGAQALLYQYRLDGVDTGWSAWATITSALYDLPNGTYTFWVRGKDEAGNFTGDETSTVGVLTSHTFVVNAAPRVASTSRIDRGIWASRVTLEVPLEGGQPGDRFVLLPEHSGMNDPHLTPVSIHSSGTSTPVGANTIVAGELGVPGTITEAARGWVVILPTLIPPGGTAEYEIVWGKIVYFGWGQHVAVPLGLPNYMISPGYAPWNSYLIGRYLDDGGNVWHLASRYFNPGSAYERSAWVLINEVSETGISVPERIARFHPGVQWDGTYAEGFQFLNGASFAVGQYIWHIWKEEKLAKENTGGGNEYYQYQRIGFDIYDDSNALLASYDGAFVLDDGIYVPRTDIHDRVYAMGRTYGATSTDPDEVWYAGFSYQGNEVVPRTIVETIARPKRAHYEGVFRCGANVILLWYEYWSTPNGDDRQNVRYQVRSLDDSIVVPSTTLNPPLEPDHVEIDDEWLAYDIMVDNDGKVWLALARDTNTSTYYYGVIGADGTVWKSATQITSSREFAYCDGDGYIWAVDGGMLHILNPDDTTAEPPRSTVFWPRQRWGLIEAARDDNGLGYRPYDRWFPQNVEINALDVPLPDKMYVFDLNLWGNALHVADLNLSMNGTSLPFPSGQFVGQTTVDVADSIMMGANVLTLAQQDFQGGQVLITFPYQGCETNADCDDGQSCNGMETCDASGRCRVGASIDCNDGVGCTVDSCDESDDSCDNIASNGLCDNGSWCDGSETCDPVADCQPGADVDCNDGVSCTVDSCNEGTHSCDNIPSNGLCDDGSWCDGSETCDPVADCQPGTDVDCNDGVDCTLDSCNESTDSCDNIPSNGLCDNGAWCNGSETCDPVQDCQPGTDPCPGLDCDEVNDGCLCDDDGDCDDGVDCTINSCGTSGICVYTPNDSACSNGLFCDGIETCDAVAGCQLGADPCDDEIDCTEDTCVDALKECHNDVESGNCLIAGACYADGEENPGNSCQSCQPLTDALLWSPRLDETSCNDGNSCTSGDSCESGTCTGTPSPDPCCGNPDPCCGSSDPCCGSSDPCCGISDPCCGVDCDDGLFCNGAETCVDGECQPGDLPCAEACCEPSDACEECPCTSDAQCNDGDACNGVETCDPITGCQPGTPLDCSDENPCTQDECVAGVCQFESAPREGQGCDDGDACTESDSCSDGTCVGVAIDCDDGNPCTEPDLCVNGVCETDIRPNGAPCGDGLACFDGDCAETVEISLSVTTPVGGTNTDPLTAARDFRKGDTIQAMIRNSDPACETDCPINQFDCVCVVWPEDADCPEPCEFLHWRDLESGDVLSESLSTGIPLSKGLSIDAEFGNRCGAGAPCGTIGGASGLLLLAGFGRMKYRRMKARCRS